MTLLATDDLTLRFAGLVAVDGLSFAVAEGGVHAVIGPNGAGKTSLFNLITGLVAPTSGQILFAGSNIRAAPPHRRAALGIARTFQNIRIFPEMSVLENTLTGLHPRLHTSLFAVVARTRSFRAAERGAVARAREALGLVGLDTRADILAGALSYGDQRRLEIARAMAQGPRLLLLDEPAAGMNPAETRSLATLVRRIADLGTTVLLVEHDMPFVMGLSDHVTVLNFGRLIFDGAPAACRADPAVIEAYLGAALAEKLRASPA